MEDIQSNQYLSFRVVNEMFSLNVKQVREVLDMTRITRVPRMPEYIRGVINLRGSVVPVLDLGKKLGYEMLEVTEDTSIVVAEVELGEETLVLGLMCDGVDEVISLSDEDIEPPPKVGDKIDRNYIQGMGKIGEDFLIIMNISRVLEDEDLGIYT